MKILMVCLGNICRSPMAEAIMWEKATKAGLNWTVASAGTDGYHVAEPPHALSQKVAKLHGLDISRQRARLFVAEDFDKYDKIYAMAGNVIRDMRHIARKKFNLDKVDLLMNELHPNENADIPDPYYGHEMGYHQAYEMMEQACDAIIEKYANIPPKTDLVNKVVS